MGCLLSRGEGRLPVSPWGIVEGSLCESRTTTLGQIVLLQLALAPLPSLSSRSYPFALYRPTLPGYRRQGVQLRQILV